MDAAYVATADRGNSFSGHFPVGTRSALARMVRSQLAAAARAGGAEIYGYSHLGPDPLRDLITKELCLETKPISGEACVFDDEIFQTADALADHFGPAARDEAKAFRAKCAARISLASACAVGGDTA